MAGVHSVEDGGLSVKPKDVYFPFTTAHLGEHLVLTTFRNSSDIPRVCVHPSITWLLRICEGTMSGSHSIPISSPSIAMVLHENVVALHSRPNIQAAPRKRRPKTQAARGKRRPKIQAKRRDSDCHQELALELAIFQSKADVFLLVARPPIQQ